MSDVKSGHQIQRKSELDETTRIFRQLKSIRSQMKRQLKELHVRSKEDNASEIEKLEGTTRGLAEEKTLLRKKFDRNTGRNGPYKKT